MPLSRESLRTIDACAAFDNPDLIVACVVGDGEAETGPLATGWGSRAAYVKQAIRDKVIEHKEYIGEHGEDMPEIRDWRWDARA